MIDSWIARITKITSLDNGILALKWRGNRFYRTLIKDFIYLVPGISARLLQGFVINIILAIYISPKEMGTFTLFLLGQVYLNALLSGWLTNSCIRFLPENKGEAFYLLRLVVNYSFILILFGSLVLLFIKKFISDDVYINIIATFGVLMGGLVFQTFQSMIRGLFMLTYFSLFNILYPVFTVMFLLILLPKFGNHVFGALLIMGVCYLPLCLYQYFILNKQVTPECLIADRQGVHKVLIKYFKYGLPLCISYLLLNFLFSADRYILVYFCDLATVGIYAFWMVMGLNIIRGSQEIIMFVLNPRLFQLYAQDEVQALTYTRHITKWYVLLALPTIIVLGRILPDLFHLLKVKENYLGHPGLIFPGMLSGFFLGLAQLCGKSLEFRKKTGFFIFAAAAGALIMFASLLISLGLFKMGIYVAGFCSTLGMLTYLILIGNFSREYPSIKNLLISLTVSSFLFLGMAYIH